MTFTYAGYSNIGKRANNEDAYSTAQDKDSLIAVVADGLGGHANGEVASQIAVENIVQRIRGKQFDEDELGYALLDAHNKICETKTSACTTAAALWIHRSEAISAHVGDTRVYQFRDGKIIFMTEDHSAVQVAVSLGQLPADACRNHKDRNKVYNVLGEEKERPKVDICNLDVQPGDRFLLCSDGFWEPITEEMMIESISSFRTPQDCLNAMENMIQGFDYSKQDNNTAVLIYIDP